MVSRSKLVEFVKRTSKRLHLLDDRPVCEQLGTSRPMKRRVYLTSIQEINNNGSLSHRCRRWFDVGKYNKRAMYNHLQYDGPTKLRTNDRMFVVFM